MEMMLYSIPDETDGKLECGAEIFFTYLINIEPREG